MTDKATLVKQFKDLGIKAGMTLLVHSSLRRVGKVDGGADTIIDALLEVLGENGTLLMSGVSGNVNPDQPVYHVKYTPATVGTLVNVFMKRDNVVRSLHPVHSVAGCGPRAKYITDGHLEANTPWSPDSPYGKLMREENGFILFLGTNFTCNTCIHALEIEARVPGLHTKDTSKLYVFDYDNNLHVIDHHWHSRKKDYYVDMEHVVAAAGGLVYGEVGTGMARLCDAQVLRKTVLPILQSTPEKVIKRLTDNDYIWE